MSVSYEVAGEGPTVLLIAGGAATRRSWQPVVHHLVESGFHVVTFDHRGVGESPVTNPPYTVDQLARDVEHLVETLELSRVTLVGHSLGAAVAARLAGRCEWVEAAVLVAGPAFSALNRHWLTFIGSLIDASGDEAGTLLALPSAISVLPPALLQNDDVAEMVLSAAVQERVDVRGLRGHVTALQEWHTVDLSIELAKISAPTRVVAFSDDVHAPPGHGAAAAAHLRRGDFVSIPGHGHAGVQTAAAELCATIVDVLELSGSPAVEG